MNRLLVSPHAAVEPLFEAAPQFLAGSEDREVARAPWREADDGDVVASVAVAAGVRFRFSERT